MTLVDRIADRVRYDENGCWTWTGAVTKHTRPGSGGYGLVSIDGVLRLAHRVAYEEAVGPIPEGLTLDHLCRNRACVNPAHLEPVGLRTNILRGTGPSAANARKTHCPQGHAYVGSNLFVDRSGRRHCRTCRRARSRAWWQIHGTDYRRALSARTGV